MTKQDKIGLVVLITLFVAFATILVFSWPRATETRKLEDNVIVQQRMINLEKSR